MTNTGLNDRQQGFVCIPSLRVRYQTFPAHIFSFHFHADLKSSTKYNGPSTKIHLLLGI